ncbi:hypothetical protein, partial [Vibrio parahaemolyticus]|uniref:hypothetical protein n=1 Tax=Vibrio parahaemolyticus TaxID=670 RepID=UPI0021113F90
VARIVRFALPHCQEYLDQRGEAGYHSLLDELEELIILAINEMLAGQDADRETLERASEILKVSVELDATNSKASRDADAIVIT